MNLDEVDLFLQDWTSLALDDEHDRKLLALLLADRFGAKPFDRYLCVHSGPNGQRKQHCVTLRKAIMWCLQEEKTIPQGTVSLIGFDEHGTGSGTLLEWNAW